MHQPVKYRVVPSRIGRIREVTPFTVALGTHHRNTADLVAARIHKHVQSMLLSQNVGVNVDLDKGTWSINGGRYGGGTLQEID